jgi:hypothetical protein
MYNQENYWADIDSCLSELKANGHVKLPSLKQFNMADIANKINTEMNGKTFMELGDFHKSFLQDLGIEKHLTPKLFKIAQEVFDYNGDEDNQYHIARRVEPGNSKEMYRAHFDSHLFTLVLPIKIPSAPPSDSIGDLLYFPKARKVPKNEISNFFGKVAFKRFASKKGMEKLALQQDLRVDNFQDYSPLLFIGNTTLHTNRKVSESCSSYRLTLLAHFFDPSPKYGVGSILRLVRGR